MTFDPYYEWLGIPSEERPPSHYRLLGINMFEDNREVISSAAERQVAHIRSFLDGPHAAIAQRLLDEITAALDCLLNPDRRQAYDEHLRHRLMIRAIRPRAKKQYSPLLIGLAVMLVIAIVVAFSRPASPPKEATNLPTPRVASVPPVHPATEQAASTANRKDTFESVAEDTTQP